MHQATSAFWKKRGCLTGKNWSLSLKLNIVAAENDNPIIHHFSNTERCPPWPTITRCPISCFIFRYWITLGFVIHLISSRGQSEGASYWQASVKLPTLFFRHREMYPTPITNFILSSVFTKNRNMLIFRISPVTNIIFPKQQLASDRRIAN